MVVSIPHPCILCQGLPLLFMGPKLPEYENVKEAPAPMLIGMGILAFIVIAFGLFPRR